METHGGSVHPIAEPINETTREAGEQYFSLRAWVNTQLRQYRAYLKDSYGKDHSMNDAKAGRLRDAGFDFGKLGEKYQLLEDIRMGKKGALIPGKKKDSEREREAKEKEREEKKMLKEEDKRLAKLEAEERICSGNGGGGDGGSANKRSSKEPIPRKSWLDVLEKVKDFQATHGGSLDIPKQKNDEATGEIVDKDIEKLRVWCYNQRSPFYHYKFGTCYSRFFLRFVKKKSTFSLLWRAKSKSKSKVKIEKLAEIGNFDFFSLFIVYKNKL